MRAVRGFILLLILVAWGCNRTPPTPLVRVTGNLVTGNNRPLAGTLMSFYTAQGKKIEEAGGALTDRQGGFRVMNKNGGDGLAAGEYKIILSRKIYQNGKLAPPDAPSQLASESLPDFLTHPEKTILLLKVVPGMDQVELNVPWQP